MKPRMLSESDLEGYGGPWPKELQLILLVFRVKEDLVGVETETKKSREIKEFKKKGGGYYLPD